MISLFIINLKYFYILAFYVSGLGTKCSPLDLNVSYLVSDEVDRFVLDVQLLNAVLLVETLDSMCRVWVYFQKL